MNGGKPFYFSYVSFQVYFVCQLLKSKSCKPHIQQRNKDIQLIDHIE